MINNYYIHIKNLILEKKYNYFENFLKGIFTIFTG